MYNKNPVISNSNQCFINAQGKILFYSHSRINRPGSKYKCIVERTCLFVNFHPKKTVLICEICHVNKISCCWQWMEVIIITKWIMNYLCNQCLSPLKLWVCIVLMARCTRYNIMWSSLSVISLGTPVSSTNKTDCHDVTEILLKVALNIITLTPEHR